MNRLFTLSIGTVLIYYTNWPFWNEHIKIGYQIKSILLIKVVSVRFFSHLMSFKENKHFIKNQISLEISLYSIQCLQMTNV